MSNPFIAEIRVFAGNFAPRGWAMCDGQLLPINQNQALFSLLGTFYGGDGRTNFALPNLQGSVPISQGQGPGLSDFFVGESAGTEAVTLLSTDVQSHTHAAQAVVGVGQSPNPTNNLWAEARVGRGTVKMYSDVLTSPAAINPFAVGVVGGLPHNNVPPVLVMTFIIALQGIYPARN